MPTLNSFQLPCNIINEHMDFILLLNKVESD